MKTYTLLVPEPGDQSFGCSLDIVDADGRLANGLNFDELLGQIVSLCHPKLDGQPQYRMRTPAEWKSERDERARQRDAIRNLSAPIRTPTERT